MINLPLVSVGIPTYNRPNGLEKTLNYLLTQEYKNIEIIISDNCSTDPNVKTIIEKYANLDCRIRYFIQTENIEAEPNFNFVYHHAIGIYFMWMSDDDLFDSNYISACVQFLEINNDYIHCAGLVSYFKNEKIVLIEKKLSLENNHAFSRLLKYFFYVQKNGVFYGITRLKTKFENPIGKFVGSDWVHIARLSLLGKIKVLGSIKANRDLEGGSSSRKKMTTRWELNKMKTIFFETYTAFQVAKNIFKSPILNKKFNKLYKYFTVYIIFVLLNFKFLIYSIKRRL